MECTLGLMLLQLRSSGATVDGYSWLLGDKRIRVLRAPNQLLHHIEAKHVRETAPTTSPDIVIAVGAEADCLPSDIVRAGSVPTIPRVTTSRMVTRQHATEGLGRCADAANTAMKED